MPLTAPPPRRRLGRFSPPAGADLPGRAVDAAVELAVQDDADPDPGSDREVDELPRGLPGAVGVLTQGREVRVVLDRQVAVQPLPQRGGDGQLAGSRQVGREPQLPAVGAVDAGTAHDGVGDRVRADVGLWVP